MASVVIQVKKGKIKSFPKELRMVLSVWYCPGMDKMVISDVCSYADFLACDTGVSEFKLLKVY